MNYTMSVWPVLIDKTKEVYRLRDAGQLDELRSLGEATLDQVKDLYAQSQAILSHLVDDAWALGVIRNFSLYEEEEERLQTGVQSEGENNLNGTSTQAQADLPATHMQWLQLVVATLVMDVVLCRIAYDLSEAVHGPKEVVTHVFHDRYKASCQQIWGLIPHLRTLGPMAGMLCMAPFYMAFESLETEAARTRLIDFIKTTSARKLLPETEEHTKLWLANIGRLVSGRELLKPRNGDIQSVSIWNTTH